MNVDVLRAAAHAAAAEHGVRVVEHPGWETNSHGALTIRGAVWHDTVTTDLLTTDGLGRLLADGYKTLPGPIANVGVDRDGTIVLTAAGKAWHAGAGSWPGIDDDNANAATVGIEVANRGAGSGETWTPVQMAVTETFTVELARLAGFDASTVFAHREWAPGRKRDPWSVDMDAARGRIAGRLDMPLTETDIARIVDGVMRHELPYAEVPLWLALDRTYRTVQIVRTQQATGDRELTADEVAAAVVEALDDRVASRVLDLLSERLAD